jgi:hypothetical protein
MGDSNMKKFLSIIFSASLIFGMGTSALADESPENFKVQEALNLIIKTNAKIQEKIDKAEADAAKVRTEYLADVVKMGGIVEESELTLSLKATKQTETTIEDIQDVLSSIEIKLLEEAKIDKTEDHLQAVKDEISEISTLLAADETVNGFATSGEIIKKDNGAVLYWQYKELTDKYVKKLDKIITNVYTQTKKMSEHTIKKVEGVVVAECELVSVTFGHLDVMIDPIRIVGI